MAHKFEVKTFNFKQGKKIGASQTLTYDLDLTKKLEMIDYQNNQNFNVTIHIHMKHAGRMQFQDYLTLKHYNFDERPCARFSYFQHETRNFYCTHLVGAKFLINRRFRVLQDFCWVSDAYNKNTTATTEIGFFEIHEESNEADYDLMDFQKVYNINKWKGFGTSFNHNSEILEVRKHLDEPSNIFIFENVEDLQW